MRSLELGTPSQRSPLNRERIVTEEQPAVTPIVQDVNMGFQIPPWPSSADSTSKGKETRDAQLRDLSSTTPPSKNVFEEENIAAS